MHEFKNGDEVKRSDADEQGNIPAYRNMRGVIFAVSETGGVKVEWNGLKYDRDENWRDPKTIVLVSD